MKVRKFLKKHLTFFLLLIIGVLIVSIIIPLTSLGLNFLEKESEGKIRLANSSAKEANLKRQLRAITQELESFKNQDQYLINQDQKKEIENIQTTYQKAVKAYEKLLDLKDLVKKTDQSDSLFADALSLLSQRNYASASAVLASLDQLIEKEKEKTVASFKIPENVTSANTPPGSGYRRQKVTTDAGSFLVDLVVADLNSTRVIVDTASGSDCSNDCPVLPLLDYVTRNGAFAGINGSYFCPATYPTCSEKKNSFDTLLMNKSKVYFNSANNVYSTVPAVIFYGNTARFVTQSLEWGRDTGVDAVIANYPLLTFNGQLFSSGGDEKQASKGNRSFIGVTGNTVYIGVVHSASVAESAKVVYTLGINSALNLDDGGSTALWYSGYKVGPGRNLPNVILLVRK